MIYGCVLFEFGYLCVLLCVLAWLQCVLTGIFAALLHHETSEIYNEEQHEHSDLEEQRFLMETKMQTMWTEAT